MPLFVRLASLLGAALTACGAPTAPGAQVAPPPLPAAEPQSAQSASAPRVLLLTGGAWHEFGELGAWWQARLAAEGYAVEWLRLGPQAPAEVAAGVTATSPAFAAERERLRALLRPERADALLLYTQGDLGFDEPLRAQFLDFVQAGGGVVALHCALDSHPGWAEYTALVGGRFQHHPPFGEIAVRVDDAAHPVLRNADSRFHRSAPVALTASFAPGTEWRLPDEFYHLQDLSLDQATLLLSGVSPEGGARRPVAWAKFVGEARVFGTILGHGREAHTDARVAALVSGALAWASRRGEPGR
ncbi:MAG: ThuA domain-containing protein [Planctomycetota bacterium]